MQDFCPMLQHDATIQHWWCNSGRFAPRKTDFDTFKRTVVGIANYPNGPLKTNTAARETYTLQTCSFLLEVQ